MRHYSIHEKQAPDAKRGQGAGNYHKSFCPHCGQETSTKGAEKPTVPGYYEIISHTTLLAERGYYERVGLYYCDVCQGRMTIHG